MADLGYMASLLNGLPRVPGGQFHLSLERRARGRTCSRQRFIALRSRTGHWQVLAYAVQ